MSRAALIVAAAVALALWGSQASSSGVWRCDPDLRPCDVHAYVPIAHRPPAPKPTLGPPPPIAVLPNHSLVEYPGQDGPDAFIVGEVYNSTDRTLNEVFVTAIIQDRHGNVLSSTDSMEAAPYVRRVPPRGVTCFEAQRRDPWRLPDGWTQYGFSVEHWERPWDGWHTITVASQQGEPVLRDHGRSDYRVSGVLRNDNPHWSYVFQVSVTAYSQLPGEPSRRVTGCIEAIVDDEDLQAGDSTSFEAVFSSEHRDYGDVTGYRIQIDASFAE